MEAEAQFIHYQLKEAMPSLMKEGQQNDGRALYALGQIFLTQGIYTGDTRTLLRSMAAFSKGKEERSSAAAPAAPWKWADFPAQGKRKMTWPWRMLFPAWQRAAMCWL